MCCRDSCNEIIIFYIFHLQFAYIYYNKPTVLLTWCRHYECYVSHADYVRLHECLLDCVRKKEGAPYSEYFCLTNTEEDIVIAYLKDTLLCTVVLSNHAFQSQGISETT